MDPLLQAFWLVFDPYNLMVMTLAGLFGMFVGAMPGLTATMATALLVPVTFFMAPVPAVAAIVTATAMAIFAGDIPGALIRIPGTPASAAYVADSYKLAQKGQAELVLGCCLVFSAIGGIFGSLVLALAAPALAEVSLSFSSFEFFWIAVFGLTCAIFISTGSPIKGVVSVLLGLFLATVGIDPTAGQPRFNMGSVELMGGVSFIPVMIGMFAISELLRWVLGSRKLEALQKRELGSVFRGQWALFLKYKWNTARSAVIGVVIGFLPGAGSDIAAWVTYAISKKFSKEPEKFGTGHIEGIVDAGTANNSSLSGAWVPALVFGIPGDSITAIVIGVLYMKGLNPGPTLMLNQPEMLYAIFIVFMFANIVMLPLGWVAIKLFRYVLNVPREVLMPLILMACIVGSFAINNSLFGVGIMLVLGIVAYFMEENGFPIAPAILGLVLGELIESSFITSMMKANGSFLAFFERPISAALGVLVVAAWIWLIWSAVRARPALVSEEEAPV
ncbi:MAG TPA: tripartite tricarboxylate transporter permease [Geminicoccus sp.]|jgi:TctA family transporter|uniref:tripartite tricarboxylate transporter permease n=1 Tax=Geminicoccus sp. TaxID=2024832 RepID=UPI002E3765AB|nr:tripartite tricarboxylate transporter permease [Geminicoccus sp.]HEX2524934.1 tripartite tricarboxylate transporter permease [Geminicoccus sp.]